MCFCLATHTKKDTTDDKIYLCFRYYLIKQLRNEMFFYHLKIFILHKRKIAWYIPKSTFFAFDSSESFFTSVTDVFSPNIIMYAIKSIRDALFLMECSGIITRILLLDFLVWCIRQSSACMLVRKYNGFYQIVVIVIPQVLKSTRLLLCMKIENSRQPSKSKYFLLQY